MADERAKALLAEIGKRGLADKVKPERLKQLRIQAFEEEPVGIGTAAVVPFIQAATGGLSRPLQVRGLAKDIGVSVPEAEKLFERREEKIAEQHPTVGMASTLAGYASPVGLFSRGMGLAGKVLGKVVRPLITRTAGATLTSGVLGGTQAISKKESAKKVADEILTGLVFGAGAGVAGEAVSAVGRPLLKAVGKGATKTLSSFRGIRPESVEFFAKNPKVVNQAIKSRLEDYIPTFVQQTNARISDFVSKQTGLIDEIVAGSSVKVSLKPVLAKTTQQINKLNRLLTTPLKRRQAKQLRQQLEMLKKLEEKGITASDLNVVKKDLQEAMQNVFAQTKIKRDTLGSALGEIEFSARKALEKVDPRIGEINRNFKVLIEAQKKLGIGSVFKEGGGLNEEQARKLLSTLHNEAKIQGGFLKAAQSVDDVVGTNIAQSSNVFKTAQDLAIRDILSAFGTGRASTLPLLGAIAGEQFDAPGVGGLAGLLLASPATTQPLIRAGAGVGRGAAGILRQAIPTTRGILEVMKEKQ